MGESRQIRVDKRTHEFLVKLSKKHGKPISSCNSMIVELFEGLVEEIEHDYKIVIEGPDGDRKHPISPLLTKRRRRTNR